MVSGVALATLLLPGEAATSVIGFSLLPFAAGKAEVAEQRRENEERDHRHRDRRAFAEFAAGDAALECELGEGAAIAVSMIPFLVFATLFSYFGLARRKWQQGEAND